jgi:signal transduction histidine kinase
VLVYAMKSEEGGILGILALGEKKSGTRYSLEDLDLLTTVTVQAGLQMHRIALQRRVLLEKMESARLEELSRLKSYFVSSVSHDLKTPLTSIRMFAELLEQRIASDDEESLKYLGIVEGECDRLSRLISNVLDFAKIEEGIKTYNFEPTELNSLVSHALDILQYQFRISGFTVQTELCETDCLFNGDADAIIEIMTNLLGNAIKYSGQKRLIRVTTASTGDAHQVAVSDQGIGIAAEDIPKLFRPFYRSNDDFVKKTGGAGLGLSLVKHIVEAHGGSIDVRSEPGHGSTFTVSFPAMEAA